MKIIQLITALGNGGAEKFVVELSNELSKSNDVIVCTYRDNEDWMIPPTKLTPAVKLHSLSVKGSRNIKNIVKAFKFIKSENPDIVHVHSSLIIYYLFFFVLIFKKTKFCYTIHSHSEFPSLKSLFNFLNKIHFLVKRWTFIALSKSIKDDFEKKYSKLCFDYVENGIAPLELSGNQLDLDIEYKPNNQKGSMVFLAIGNYTFAKRFDFLAEIFKELSDSFNVSLLIIGKDVSKDKLVEKKIILLNASNVKMLGIKTNIADYISVSDAFVCSSSIEGLPLVILEALSLGKPIITTPAGAIGEVVINNENGFITKDFSKEAFIEKIECFIQSSDEFKIKIGENNIKKFNANFTISICAQKYLNIYSFFS